MEARESARCDFLREEEQRRILKYSKYNCDKAWDCVAYRLRLIIYGLCLCLILVLAAGSQVWSWCAIATIVLFCFIVALGIGVEYDFYKKVQISQYVTGKGLLPNWCNHQEAARFKDRYNLLEDICSEINNICNILHTNDDIIDKELVSEIDENISKLTESESRLKKLISAIEATNTCAIR